MEPLRPPFTVAVYILTYPSPLPLLPHNISTGRVGQEEEPWPETSRLVGRLCCYSWERKIVLNNAVLGDANVRLRRYLACHRDMNEMDAVSRRPLPPCNRRRYVSL